MNTKKYPSLQKRYLLALKAQPQQLWQKISRYRAVSPRLKSGTSTIKTKNIPRYRAVSPNLKKTGNLHTRRQNVQKTLKKPRTSQTKRRATNTRERNIRTRHNKYTVRWRKNLRRTGKIQSKTKVYKTINITKNTKFGLRKGNAKLERINAHRQGKPRDETSRMCSKHWGTETRRPKNQKQSTENTSASTTEGGCSSASAGTTPAAGSSATTTGTTRAGGAGSRLTVSHNARNFLHRNAGEMTTIKAKPRNLKTEPAKHHARPRE